MTRCACVAIVGIAGALATSAALAAPETVYWDLDLRPTSQIAQDEFYSSKLVRPGDYARLATSQSTTGPTQSSHLIPPKDEFGLPGPVWLFELLLPTTFYLHVLFMNITLGTALLAIPLTLLASKRPHICAALQDLFAAWPIAMSLTITTGIAPLLFVQVLYGHFFFVSSILLGWFWLAIVVALLAAFYGIYIAKAAAGHGTDPSKNPAARPPSVLHWTTLATIAAACIFVAALFTANTTLMLLPEEWKQVHEGRQLGWMVHPMFWPRLAHNLIGSVAATGMFIAIRARVKRVGGLHEGDTFHLIKENGNLERVHGESLVTQMNESRAKTISLGLLIALCATCLQVADGVWFVATIFHDAVTAFHQPTPGTVLWALAVFSSIALIIALFKGLDHPERGSAVWLPAGLLAFILVGMSAGRERVRIGMLHRHLDKLYTEADVRPQTLTTILFFITLFAGLALIGLMVRWMFTGRRNEANLPS